MAAGTGYAKDWGIKTVSSGLIAYVVELVSICLQDVIPTLPFQVRFSLSSEPNYANVDFDYIQCPCGTPQQPGSQRAKP